MTIEQNSANYLHPFLDGKTKRLFIDGLWQEAVSGKSLPAINPSNGRIIANFAAGDHRDVDLAVASARKALSGPWSKFKPYDRQNLLIKLAELTERHFDELALLDTLDMGAPVGKTMAGRRRILGMLRYYAGQATAVHGETIENSIPGDYLTYTMREPIGVVGAIIPWNAPLAAIVWKIGPVLATGCTIILKPAEQASLTALRFAELCEEVGVPSGVVNVVTGEGQFAGAAIAEHPGVNKIAFTGSNATGQKILRASTGNLKRVTLELGGKSPDIVFADADMSLAVEGAAMAVFGNSGQVCSAGSRLFVERSIYEEFTVKVAEFSRSLRVGDGLDPSTQIGPLVSAQQLDRVVDYMDSGREDGARILAGGGRLTEGELADGYYVSPTVFADVRDDMRIVREEIFGPVVSAIPFDEIDEVIAQGNKTEFGLGSGVWTKDISKAHRVARGLEAGSVWVNCYQVLDPAVPFGGYKMSGQGREGGRDHIKEYLNIKSIWIRT